MPTTVRSLTPYQDDDGNVIEYDGTGAHGRVDVLFRGTNNRLIVHPEARTKRLSIRFDCDNGVVELGGNPKNRNLELSIRVGQDSTVRIGDDVSTTTVLLISAVEGTTVSIGNDVMFASGNQLRGDDGHPIFDVRTGARVNHSKDITIGDHVWMGREACALGGASVASGSVIGYRSLVTGRIPNNAIAVGTPARVVRRDIAWERPHLSLAKPYYKPDASTVTRSDEFWASTKDLDQPVLAVDRGVRARPALGQRVRAALRALRGA